MCGLTVKHYIYFKHFTYINLKDALNTKDVAHRNLSNDESIIQHTALRVFYKEHHRVYKAQSNLCISKPWLGALRC